MRRMRTKLKNFIGKISFKKHIKILLLIFSIIWIFSWFTFADELVCNGNSAKDTFVELLYNILTFLSRWWILLANLAGKLMTNDVVYGTFLHLDGTLWTFWNVMKNIANFLLWFLVLFSILKNLLSPVWVQSKPLDTIKNTLIAGILIQMSWFLVWVALDISTICTAAIGSFPAQFLTIDDEFQSNVRDTVLSAYNHKLIVDYSNTSDYIRVETWWHAGESASEEEINQLLDTILPSTDSLSGPLIYIGMAVFDFKDFNKHKPGDCEWRGSLLLSVWLDWAVVIAYSIIMLLLFIFNLTRILLLWLIIPSMPLIIVAKFFEFKWEKFLWEITNIWNILKLIFKPVLMVWVLSIVLIIMVLIKGIINNDHWPSKVEIPNTNLTMTTKENGSSMDIDGLLNVNLDWYKEWFAGVVVYILWLCLMFFVLKMAELKTWIWFIDKTITGIFDRAKSIMTAAPIIPIPGGSPVSIDTLKNSLSSEEVLAKKMWINIPEQDAFIETLVGMKWYDSLRENMTREDFIREAYKISKQQWINNANQLNNSHSHLVKLNDKIGKWNKHPGHTPAITIDDIFSQSSSKKDEETSESGESSE